MAKIAVYDCISRSHVSHFWEFLPRTLTSCKVTLYLCLFLQPAFAPCSFLEGEWVDAWPKGLSRSFSWDFETEVFVIDSFSSRNWRTFICRSRGVNYLPSCAKWSRESSLETHTHTHIEGQRITGFLLLFQLQVPVPKETWPEVCKMLPILSETLWFFEWVFVFALQNSLREFATDTLFL